VAVEDKHKAAAVVVADKQLLEVEHKCAGAGENRTPVDTASEQKAHVHRCMAEADRKLEHIHINIGCQLIIRLNEK